LLCAHPINNFPADKIINISSLSGILNTPMNGADCKLQACIGSSGGNISPRTIMLKAQAVALPAEVIAKLVQEIIEGRRRRTAYAFGQGALMSRFLSSDFMPKRLADWLIDRKVATEPITLSFTRRALLYVRLLTGRSARFVGHLIGQRGMPAAISGQP
jgi:hypothetical protein